MHGHDGLPIGKLPPDLLAEVLAPLAPRDPCVLVGPGAGEDAAVIAMGARCLVAASDPITFAAEEIGHYAVAVNANDVAVRGAVPRWFLATVLLPAGTTARTVRAVMADLSLACRAMEIDLVGGHTEVTAAVSRPVVAGTMLGEVDKDRVVTTGGARPGDVLVLGGVLAVEGTAILAREAAALLAQEGVAAQEINATRALLREPGISVVAMARTLCDEVTPHAMHDPTEGGLATALAELAVASGVGLHVAAPDDLPVLPQTRHFCAALGLDPLGLLASGALLAAVDKDDAPRALAALHAHGHPAAAIGTVFPPQHSLTIGGNAGSRPLPAFERDELARLFS